MADVNGPDLGNWLRACDFLLAFALLFRQIYASFATELGSWRVVHFAIPAHPTDVWAAQELREGTPQWQTPRPLIGDLNGKYGGAFGRVSTGTSIEVRSRPIAFREPRPSANSPWEV